MQPLRGAWFGLVLGALAGLACTFTLLPTVSVEPVHENEAECGMWGLFVIMAGPVFPVAGALAGCVCGFLVGVVRDSAERARASALPRMIVAPYCPNCGRYATIPERNVSPLCPGCGETLPHVPYKSDPAEL